MNAPTSGSLDGREPLEGALRAQGATPAEIAEWLPVVRRLGEWPDHAVTSADNQRLLAALAPSLPQRSAVRQAIRERYARRRGALDSLLDTARVQVSILRPSFWLLSAAITLLGAYLELSPWNGDGIFFLRALGPLLVYLSISTIFRGMGLHTLECESTCPPSAVQLAIARLVIVLGYDIALGLCLGLALWLHGQSGAGGEVSFLAVTLHWLMPLLLVAGLALVLSLRLPIAVASGIAYLSWLAVLGLYYAYFYNLGLRTIPPLPLGLELALGLAGIVLLAVGTLAFPSNVSRLTPTL